MTPNDEDGNLARYVDQTGHDIVSSVSCDLPAWPPWQCRRNWPVQGCDDVTIRDSFHHTAFLCVMYGYCDAPIMHRYLIQGRLINQGMKHKTVCRSADQTGHS
jgi:hypothetical protein